MNNNKLIIESNARVIDILTAKINIQLYTCNSCNVIYTQVKQLSFTFQWMSLSRLYVYRFLPLISKCNIWISKHLHNRSAKDLVRRFILFFFFVLFLYGHIFLLYFLFTLNIMYTRQTWYVQCQWSNVIPVKRKTMNV